MADLERTVMCYEKYEYTIKIWLLIILILSFTEYWFKMYLPILSCHIEDKHIFLVWGTEDMAHILPQPLGILSRR
jgi:hypothetical protein